MVNKHGKVLTMVNKHGEVLTMVKSIQKLYIVKERFKACKRFYMNLSWKRWFSLSQNRMGGEKKRF
jgi:hypothetical protein